MALFRRLAQFCPSQSPKVLHIWSAWQFRISSFFSISSRVLTTSFSTWGSPNRFLDNCVFPQYFSFVSWQGIQNLFTSLTTAKLKLHSVHRREIKHADLMSALFVMDTRSLSHFSTLLDLLRQHCCRGNTLLRFSVFHLRQFSCSGAVYVLVYFFPCPFSFSSEQCCWGHLWGQLFVFTIVTTE